jgi:hypothetical protein
VASARYPDEAELAARAPFEVEEAKEAVQEAVVEESELLFTQSLLCQSAAMMVNASVLLDAGRGGRL